MNYIKCNKCKKEKDESDFIKNEKIVKTCLACRQVAQEWRGKNKERVSLYNKMTNVNKTKDKEFVYAKKKGEEEWIKFNSQLDASKELNLYAPNINKVIKGILKTTGGYEFKVEIQKVEGLNKNWKDIKETHNIKNQTISHKRKKHIKKDDIVGKECCSCKEWKPLTDYNNSKSHWDHLRNECKECLVLWRKKNRKQIQKTNTAYETKRKKVDPAFKLLLTLRSRLNNALTRQNSKKNTTTIELIGESPVFVMGYLAAKFKEGMTWDNHGEWHIDHIKPCCKFNLLDKEEQKKCFHYTNLQPLWSQENLSKGGNYASSETSSSSKIITI